MGPKKNTKTTLKKAGTMAATAAAGREFLKQSWGEEKLNQVNGYLDARDKSSSSSSSSDEEPPTASSTTATSSKPSKSKAKPKLSKARTMKTTAKEAKTILGKEVLGDTRADTKRRQAAVNAKKVLQEVTKPSGGRKPAIKRLGTMGNTAREGKAYIARTGGAKKTTGRTRTGGRTKKGRK